MIDTRVFATKNMIAKDSTGETASLKKLKTVFTVPKQAKKTNFRNLLYIFYLPLLIIQWITVLVFNIWEVIYKSITELTISLQSYINADSIAVESET